MKNIKLTGDSIVAIVGIVAVGGLAIFGAVKSSKDRKRMEAEQAAKAKEVRDFVDDEVIVMNYPAQFVDIVYNNKRLKDTTTKAWLYDKLLSSYQRIIAAKDIDEAKKHLFDLNQYMQYAECNSADDIITGLIQMQEKRNKARQEEVTRKHELLVAKTTADAVVRAAEIEAKATRDSAREARNLELRKAELQVETIKSIGDSTAKIVKESRPYGGAGTV